MQHDKPQDMDDKAISHSEGRSGEEVGRTEQEAGRHDEGPQGPTDRPTGGSDIRDMTGVDPKPPITGGDESPNG